jgi:hypothetical protein
VNDATQGPVRWITAAALSALADNGVTRAGLTFTADNLAGWTRGTLRTTQRVDASSRLCALGFVKHSQVRELVRGQQCRQIDVYTLTAEGAEAVKAAAAGHVRKSGPKGSRKANPIDQQALTSRLWQMVRIRKIVDSDVAARLLCDAGDEEEFRRMRDSIRRYLRRWANVGSLAESVRRVHSDGAGTTSNGSKRYVLVIDSPEPPKWWPKAQGRDSNAGDPAGACA